jgi:hypothetical protein
MKHLFAAALVLTLITYGALSTGYVLSQLWLWFVVPVFQLPALGMYRAIGLSLVVRLLTVHGDFKKGEVDVVKFWLQALLLPWVFYVVAVIVRWIGGAPGSARSPTKSY